MKLIKGMKYPLHTIINFIQNDEHAEKLIFCLYSEDSEANLTSDTLCYFDEYPDGDDSGNDVFPDFVQKNRLELIYYGDNFVDVITNLKNQTSPPDSELVILALNYFMDHDDFMEIN